MTITVQAGQTAIDIAIQQYGTVEALVTLLADNNLELDSDLIAGQQLYIQDTYPATADTLVANFLTGNNITIAGSDPASIEVLGTNDEDIITTNNSDYLQA
jgi:hypothetical protein